MMLKFWGEWKLLPQSAFKVYSFWCSIQKDKLSQYASSCCHTPAARCQWHRLLCLCHCCPVPWKRLSMTHGLLPATHEGLPPPSSTGFQPCKSNEQAPVGEWRSQQGSCPSSGQTHPKEAQQAQGLTERISSNLSVWRHMSIIYRKEKVILQYWSYSAASKMTEHDIRLKNLSWNH